MKLGWKQIGAAARALLASRAAAIGRAQYALGLLMVAILVGCSGNPQVAPIPRVDGITGSGRLVTQELPLSGFTGVAARSAFKLDVFQSESYQVEVTADDNVIDHMDVKVTGDRLTLAMTPGSYMSATYRARVGMPSLRSLDLSEASTATVSGFKSVEDVEFSLKGASKLTGRVEAGQVRLSPGEASVVTLGGKAESLTVEASGASEAHLGDWAVGSASVSLREASRATLNVAGRLDADLRAASTLYYVGNPTLGSVSSLEASSLKRR
jgi:hypothetical protein